MTKFANGRRTSFVTMMANTSSLLYNRMENIILCAGEGYPCSWTIPGEHCLRPNSGRLRRLRTAVAEERILCINNVHSFNGHIVCDTASNSEIVLPVRINNTVVGARTSDSPAFSRFSSEDEL